MGLPARQPESHFTYADYLTWPDNERWELIDGSAYAMSPAPSNFHQLIVGELFATIHQHLRGKPCRPFVAPFDVRLPRVGTADAQIDTVVQPDISVVCDPAKLRDNRGCLGAPDWLIEVLSPRTAVHDQRVKRSLYETQGVAEYWLVHPTDRTITIYQLNAATEGTPTYGKPLLFGLGDECAPQAFPELVIDVTSVFSDLPPIDDARL